MSLREHIVVNKTKYEQIAEILKEEIRSGKYKEGDPFYSELQLAKLFHVTQMTIRQAFAVLRKEGLIESIKGKGTFVKHNRLKKIGIFVWGNSDTLSHPAFHEFMRGCNEVFIKNEILLSLFFVDYHNLNKEEILSLVKNAGVRGVIIPVQEIPDKIIKEVSDIMPCVVVNHYIDSDQCYKVVWNMKIGAYLATKHLCNMKYKDLYLINVNLHKQVAEYMEEGFLKGLKESNKETKGKIKRISSYSANDTKKVTQEILSEIKRKKTGKISVGFITADDTMAYAVREIIQSEGYIIPNQIGIIGFGNTEICTKEPPFLSSVKIPFREMGKSAAEILLTISDKKTGEEDTKEVYSKELTFMPELVPRESTGIRHKHQDSSWSPDI